MSKVKVKLTLNVKIVIGDNYRTLVPAFLTLSREFSYDEEMITIHFLVAGSRVKVTMTLNVKIISGQLL